MGRGGGDDCLHPYEAWYGRKPAVSHLAASRSVRSLATSASSTTGALQGCSSATRRSRRPTAFLTQGQRVRTTHDVVFDEGRGWAWDKAVDDGSTSTYDNFTVEYTHFEGDRGVGSSLPPSMSTCLRASTDLGATLSGHDLGYNEVFATTTTVDAPMHSISNGHPSGHVHSDTSSCRELSRVRYSAPPRRGAHQRVPRQRAVAV
jgi:hypothetical protein